MCPPYGLNFWSAPAADKEVVVKMTGFLELINTEAAIEIRASAFTF
jgi:hypothetical protein